MTVLPNMNLTLPVRGAPGAGQWGDTIDTDLALIDGHSHQAGKGLPITTAAISINADLPFSSLWAPTQLHRVQFSAIAGGALAAGQRTSLFVSDGTSGLVASELYWHNSAGNKVQITAGNTLNFAAFVGGIGGDYTSVGATLNYTDAQKAYEFKEGTIDSHGWSRLRSGDLRLFPFNTTGAVFVGMAAPGAIAGSYTVTWPLALPGSQVFAQIDNTGQIVFSNTVPGSVTLASGQNVTLSGAGEVKHGNVTLAFPGCQGISQSITNFTYDSTNGAILASGNVIFIFPVPLTTGDRVQSVTFARFGDATANITAMSLIKVTAGGTPSNLATGSVSTPAASWNDSTMTVGSPVALASGECLLIRMAIDASNIRINDLRVVYDRP